MEVVVTYSGERYHKIGGNCGYRPDLYSSGMTIYESEEEAEEEGHEPCQICMT